MRKHEEAVSHTYSYLLLHLKPSTPEKCQLKTNVLPNDQKLQRAKRMSDAKAIKKFLRKESKKKPPEIN